MRIYILLLAIAVAATFIALPVINKIARRVGAVTPIRDRDIHKNLIPRMGGLAMFFGFFVAIIFAWFIPFFHRVMLENSQIWGVILASFLITLLGIADDIFDIDWMLKLVGQIICSLILALSGIQIAVLPFFGLTVGSSLASIVITSLVIVAIMNAINFIDGLDGLLSGVIAISSLAFFFYSYVISFSYISYASITSLISIIVVGICLGFLTYNFYPAKMFMGDTGSMLLGMLISCSTIITISHISFKVNSVESLPAYLPIVFPILVLIIPILDMVLAVVRRVRQKKSPFSPDKKHLHHKMLMLGHTVVESVLLFYGWVTLFSFTVLALIFFDSTYVFVCSGTIFAIMAFFMFRRRMFVVLTSDERMKNTIRLKTEKNEDVIALSRKDPLDSVVEIVEHGKTSKKTKINKNKDKKKK